MCVIHVRVSFFSPEHSWDIDYYAFGTGELQDTWRLKMDPLMGGPRMAGVTYRIGQVE
jgi:hypothetical protein